MHPCARHYSWYRHKTPQWIKRSASTGFPAKTTAIQSWPYLTPLPSRTWFTAFLQWNSPMPYLLPSRRSFPLLSVCHLNLGFSRFLFQSCALLTPKFSSPDPSISNSLVYSGCNCKDRKTMVQRRWWAHSSLAWTLSQWGCYHPHLSLKKLRPRDKVPCLSLHS